MTRKLSLPLFNLARTPVLDPSTTDQKPTVDAVRKRLGGRGSTEADAGDLVTLTTPGGGKLQGVIVFASGDNLDVWIDQDTASRTAPPRVGVVRRAHRAHVAPLRVAPSRDLDAMANDARVFGALLEGQRILFQTDEGVGEGTLVEKCRFGALVQRDDGTLVGVGFRRIWPARPEDAGQN